MTNARSKGQRGEREAAAKLNQIFGVDSYRRSQQFCGAAGDADLTGGVAGIAWEVKFVEKLNIHNAMDKAHDDARNCDTPAVIHRRKLQPWLVTIRADDLIEFAEKVIEGNQRR